MIRLVIVDDHASVRGGLTDVFSGQPGVVIVGQVGSGEQILDAVEDYDPDIALMELRLPGISGSDACRELRESHPQVRSILLTTHPTDANLLDGFASGARGLLLKDNQPVVLRTAVSAVARGGTFVDPKVAGKLVSLALKGQRAHGPFDLTIQELRVLEWLPRGATNPEIGEELGLSRHTVKSHVRSILQKLEASDRAEAAAIAKRHGLV